MAEYFLKRISDKVRELYEKSQFEMATNCGFVEAIEEFNSNFDCENFKSNTLFDSSQKQIRDVMNYMVDVVRKLLILFKYHSEVNCA